MRLSKRKLLAIWLTSAAIVTVARIFNAAELGELPIQIQAGQHFLTGKGLTVYSSAGEADLTQPAKLQTLAHYPAGYSIYVTGLLAAGLSVATVVKLFFAITTMLGWWGWANLAYQFLADGLPRGRTWPIAAAVIAGCTPLLYTMLWKGTDTFLWAAIPWVFCWLTTIPNQDTFRSCGVDWLVGVLSGLAFVMRYAAIFLVIYAAIVIVCQSIARLRIMATRIVAFGAGVLPLMVAQIYFAHLPNAESISDIFTVEGGVNAIIARIWHGIPFLPSANIAVAWWMPHQLAELLTTKRAIWLVCLTAAVWALVPVLLARRIGCRGVAEASRDIRMVAAGWFVLMPLFLLIWTGFADYSYVFEDRYYLPLLPVLVLIVYQLATPAEHQQTRLETWANKTSVLYLMGYVCIGVMAAARLLVPGEIGTSSRVKLMAVLPTAIHWPSNNISYDFSPGRNYILEQFKAQPGTVLVTNHEEWFYAEPDIDQARIRRLKDLQATYISGPARILIGIRDHAPGTLTAVAWYGHYDRRWVADYFQDLSDVRLLRTFPEEEIRVVEASVPAAERVFLKKETARIRSF